MKDITAQDLTDAVQGDTGALARFWQIPHAQLLEASRAIAPLIVTRAAVRRVLRDLLAKQCTREDAHRWAFFVRHGMAGDWSDQPLPAHLHIPQRIGIDYDPQAEDEIASVVSRLDEMGDRIDGEVADAELRGFLTYFPAEP